MVQKMDRDFPDFLGRERKGQAALRRLFFRAATRRSEKPAYGGRQARTKGLPFWTGEACPPGEHWSGRVFRLPQGLGLFINVPILFTGLFSGFFYPFSQITITIVCYPIITFICRAEVNRIPINVFSYFSKMIGSFGRSIAK